MKKPPGPMGLKKQPPSLVHVLFLCLFLAGITFIYFNENYGRGLNWVQEETYADTLSCTQQLESDVEMIFKYVNYKDLLEEDGELNMDADMVCVTFSSGRTVIYTLNEMIRYARSRGYYLTDTFQVAGGPAVKERDMEDAARPLIEWKAYAPNEVYREPGDQYSTLEDLSLQVLQLLAEYFQIQHNYIDQPSNLYFRVSYMDDAGEEHLYTNADGLSNEELRSLGRYLYISGDSIVMDTNLKHVPGNITAELEVYNLYDNNNYYIILGLDTSYPNDDPYSQAHDQYNRVRIDYIAGLLLFAIGGFGAAAALAVLVCLSGHSDSRPEPVTCYADRLPLECSLALCAAAVSAGLAAADYVSSTLFHLVVAKPHWDFAARLLRVLAVYVLILAEGFSLLRNFKARSLWKNSLTRRIFCWSRQVVNSRSFPFRLTAGFLAYLLVSGLLLAASAYLYLNRQLTSLSWLYLAPFLAFALFQVFCYLLLYRNEAETEKIAQGIYRMAEGDTGYKIDTAGFSGKGGTVAETLNNLGDGLETALQEQVKSERLKADLITNVSHDIKTPLTSIINYVDLLKREQIPNEKVQRYLEILDQKSQRLKNLTEDLVEASKASSGNLKLDIQDIDLVELVQQTNGEFEEKFQLRHLELVSSLPDRSIFIAADGRRLWRVLENLYNNAFKYAMESSRVYVDLVQEGDRVAFTIKNVSASPLNISPDELTERFVRGDVARTTEGSGLGLSIAKDLTRLQNGILEITIDGDLFKVQVSFPVIR